MQKKQKGLEIVPLGGCGDFGMNITMYKAEGQSIIVDVGIKFAPDHLLGVNAIMVDCLKFLKEHKPLAYVITHGHEDHIGALPYLYRMYKLPIYATPWTAELIKKKFKQNDLPIKEHLNIVQTTAHLRLKNFFVQYVPMNHSIPDACALFIKTSQGNVFHSGDFKMDFTPLGEKPFPVKMLKHIARQTVDVLLTDSTSCTKTGFSPSESMVHYEMERLIKACEGRLFISTFASHFNRLNGILALCDKYKKNLILCGRGVNETFITAEALKLVKHKNRLKTLDDVKRNPTNCVVLVSGCQGEPFSAVSRLAQDQIRQIKLREGDKFIFSSRVIPGNEKKFFNTMDKLLQKGIQVVTSDTNPNIHVSGHAYGGDIQFLAGILKPKHYAPIHGSFYHLSSNKKLLEEPTSKVNIFDGDALTLTRKLAKQEQAHEFEPLFIDNFSRVPTPKKVIHQRLAIGEMGLLVVSGAYQIKRGSFKNKLNFDMRGLYFLEPQEKIKGILEKQIIKLLKNAEKPEKLNEMVRLEMRRSLFSILGKKPIVISTIQLV